MEMCYVSYLELKTDEIVQIVLITGSNSVNMMYGLLMAQSDEIA